MCMDLRCLCQQPCSSTSNSVALCYDLLAVCERQHGFVPHVYRGMKRPKLVSDGTTQGAILFGKARVTLLILAFFLNAQWVCILGFLLPAEILAAFEKIDGPLLDKVRSVCEEWWARLSSVGISAIAPWADWSSSPPRLIQVCEVAHNNHEPDGFPHS
jgi:hypothetical protein